MKKTECVEARIVKVLSCSEKSGYRRNFRKEDRAWENVENRHRDVWSYYDREIFKDDFEDELYLQSSWDDDIC